MTVSAFIKWGSCSVYLLITSVCIMQHSDIHLLGALSIWILRIGKKGRLLNSQYGLYSNLFFFGEIQPNPSRRSYMFCIGGKQIELPNWHIYRSAKSIGSSCYTFLPTSLPVSNISSNCEITPLKLPCPACSTTEQQQKHFFFLNY